MEKRGRVTSVIPFLLAMMTIAIGAYLPWIRPNPTYDRIESIGLMKLDAGFDPFGFLLLVVVLIVVVSLRRGNRRQQSISALLAGGFTVALLLYFVFSSSFVGFAGQFVPVAGWYVTLVGGTLLALVGVAQLLSERRKSSFL